MKDSAVPRKFDCQHDRALTFTKPLRAAFEKRERKRLIKDAIEEDAKKNMKMKKAAVVTEDQNMPTTSTLQYDDHSGLLMENQENSNSNTKEEKYRSIGVQVKPSYRSKYVSCKSVNMVNAITSPVKANVVHVATSPVKLQTQKTLSFNDSETSCEEDLQNEWLPEENEEYSDSDVEINNSDFKMQCRELEIKIIENRPKTYIGVPPRWLPLIAKLEQKVGLPKHLIYLIFVKIRTDDSFEKLSDRFGVSKSYASKVFEKGVVLLSHFLIDLIFWPTPDQIVKVLPISFRSNYSQVQSIIDCLEIEIEKPSNAVHQALTWSDYKKCNTIKYLISATPGGLINFISTGYGGRTTDVTLFENCGYLDSLPEGSEIMADRGFKNIEHILIKKKCKLIRPPSVASNTKSTKEEVLLTKRIASLRIHIERVIRRVREFKIVCPHSCINNDLVHKTDNIIVIVCGLINLQSPIINQ